MLVMLSGQGYLVDTGDAYSTSVRLLDGNLTINGAAVPLPGTP